MLSRLVIAGRAVTRAGPEVSRVWAGHWTAESFTDTARPRTVSAEASPSAPRELKTDEEYQAVLANAAETNSSSVIQFTAAWCGPCRMIAPVLEQLSRDYVGEASFYKVDIDNQAVATSVAAAGVASVPTFAFMRGAQRVAQFAGADKRALENNVINLIAMG